MGGLFNFTPTSPFLLVSSKMSEKPDFSLGEKSQRRQWGSGGLHRAMEMFHLVCERGSCLVLIVSSGNAANSSARAMGFPTLQNVASAKMPQEFPSEKAFPSSPCGHVPRALGKPTPAAVKYLESFCSPR